MADLKLFLKGNKKARKETQYAATASLCDEHGEPLLWTIRALSTAEYEAIRDECTTEVQIPGKRGQYRTKVDANALIAKMIVASVVVPDLYDADLQDSYEVRTPEDLIRAMIDNPGEYDDLASFVQNYNGFDPIDTKAGDAKN